MTESPKLGRYSYKVDPEQIRKLLQDPTLRHVDIAARVGVSRERVRQIALRFGDTGYGRYPKLKAHRRANRFTGRVPRLKFSIWVNRALSEIDYRYCYCCRGAIEQNQFPHIAKGKQALSSRCKECTRQSIRKIQNAQHRFSNECLRILHVLFRNRAGSIPARQLTGRPKLLGPLKRHGYITADQHGWTITEAGRKRLKEQQAKLEATA